MFLLWRLLPNHWFLAWGEHSWLLLNLVNVSPPYAVKSWLSASSVRVNSDMGLYPKLAEFL
ncbi:hypothetical protein ASZ82_02200 [Vibrio cholerae]|nr:hypothetical protein ASZ80_02205 [Vibrio cholerae]APF53584.1 hypothetical protein ASZ82_02200 [Vibrio cholerae]ORP87616.1 hypothetical protein B7969_07050 [Vibrio cholerae]CSC93343.1 Uncharacterised protein [Vibrio cholerae]